MIRGLEVAVDLPDRGLFEPQYPDTSGLLHLRIPAHLAHDDFAKPFEIIAEHGLARGDLDRFSASYSQRPAADGGVTLSPREFRQTITEIERAESRSAWPGWMPKAPLESSART